MIFKDQFKKNQIIEPISTYTVMRVLRDELLVSTYCQKLSDDQEKDLMSKMIEEDEEGSEESDMEGSNCDEVITPASTQQEAYKDSVQCTAVVYFRG
nr:replication protein A 70 kDa DNA-binding subunit-like [Ipomoea batatas]